MATSYAVEVQAPLLRAMVASMARRRKALKYKLDGLEFSVEADIAEFLPYERLNLDMEYGGRPPAQILRSVDHNVP